jgi:DNA-binding NarL/FixJ family response regulator
MIRLAIVEDHPAIADGLIALLAGEPDVVVVGAASDAESADRLISATDPDVVLCDVRLAGSGDGLEVLARHTSGPAFIMLTAFVYPSYYVAATEHGAKGYISKMATIREIVAAVRTVAAGGTAFSVEAQGAIRSAVRRPTPRELEILRLVADGLANAEIAERLGLRVKTVESQLRRMFDRYDVGSRTGLVHLADVQGWLAESHDRPEEGH